MKALELITQLRAIAATNNVPLWELEVYFRTDYNSDVQVTTEVCEDLYDAGTNTILESVCILGSSTDED